MTDATKIEPIGYLHSNGEFCQERPVDSPEWWPISLYPQSALDAAVLAAVAERDARPIDMILHCPACGMQHIDGPEANDRYLALSDPPAAWSMPPWENKPHRSHLCHGCGHIWRPADVPTNGVAAIKTHGKNDSPKAERDAEIERLRKDAELWQHWKPWIERRAGDLSNYEAAIKGAADAN